MRRAGKARQLLPSRIVATSGQQTRSSRRFNTLIVGTPTDIEMALADLRAGFYERAYVWPDLPVPTPGTKTTLVIHEVGALAASELDLLSNVIDTAGHDLHIVSTTSRPLWQAVEAGTFPATLYYRLNWVVVDKSGCK